MRTSFKTACLVGMLALSTYACKKEMSEPSTSAASAPTTAQSIMIGGMQDQVTLKSGTEIWKFDALAAAIANHGYNSCAAATSGPGNGNACRSAALKAARDASCTYWNTEGHPFWYLFKETGNTSEEIDYDLDLTFAALSWMSNKTFPADKGGKYSFTLLDGDGSIRVKDVTYQVGSGTPVPIEILPSDMVTGNFTYVNNAFTNFTSRGWASMDRIGDAVNDILKMDSEPKNDYETFGFYVPKKISIVVPAGGTTVTVSGTLKGNTGTADTQFSVTTNIVTPPCNGGGNP